VQLAALLAAGVCLGLSLTACLGHLTQPFELFSQFRLQYLLLAAALLAIAIFARQRPAILVAGVALAVNLVAIGLVVANGAAPATRPATTTLVWANLYRKPEALAALATYARGRGADIIALTELPPDGLRLIHQAFPDFRCVLFDADQGNPFAVAIAARAPCPSSGGGVNARYADIAGWRVVAVHARPPWNNARTNERNAAIRQAFAFAAGSPRSVLVGDFNATPWAPVFGTAETTRGLRRANCGLPWRTTWRSAIPGVGLALDQAFLTPAVAVAGCDIGPDIGSDHRPLVLAFTVR